MNPRILVADDDRAFWSTIEAELTDFFDLERAMDPRSALVALEAGGYEAALISVELGRDQGYGLCAAIRKQESLRGLRVALISAQACGSEFQRHRTLRGRADVYLHKPIQPLALVEALQGMLRSPAQPAPRSSAGSAPSFWQRLFGGR